MENEADYASAMAHLEAGCHQKGFASIKFRDGEMLMMSIDLMKKLITEAEQANKDRVMIFIAADPILEGAKA